MRNLFRLIAAFGVVTFLNAAAVSADPISFTTLLTGDPRPEAPDGLKVRVSVNTLADNDHVTLWTVDLDMDDVHPLARLDQFALNLFIADSPYSFGDSSLPYETGSGTLHGSGGANFMMILNDPKGNANDATNATSLIFRLTKPASFTMDDFVLAPTSCSNNALLGCNQLGAHLVGLGVNGEGSGVAVGNYAATPVPEPATLVLLGSGAVAMALSRRRRKPAA